MCELAAGAELCDVLDTYNMANEEDVVGILQTVVATGSISVCIVGSDVIVIDFLKKFGKRCIARNSLLRALQAPGLGLGLGRDAMLFYGLGKKRKTGPKANPLGTSSPASEFSRRILFKMLMNAEEDRS